MVIRDEGPYGRGQGFRPDPSVAVTAVNVHDLTPAADLLHDDEQVVYGNTGLQGITKRPEMDTIGKRLTLPVHQKGSCKII